MEAIFGMQHRLEEEAVQDDADQMDQAAIAKILDPHHRSSSESSSSERNSDEDEEDDIDGAEPSTRNPNRSYSIDRKDLVRVASRLAREAEHDDAFEETSRNRIAPAPSAAGPRMDPMTLAAIPEGKHGSETDVDREYQDYKPSYAGGMKLTWSQMMKNEAAKTHRESLRSRVKKAWKQLKEMKMFDKRLPMILPSNPWRRRWDFLILFLVIYNAIMVPFTAAFAIIESLNLFESVVDLIFFVDILFNFRTAFIDSQGNVVKEPSKVAKQYMAMWFLIDLLASIPFDTVASMTGMSVGSNITLLAFLKTPRLLRLGRLLRFFERMKNANIFRIVRLMFLMCLMAHWIACGWHLIAISYEDSSPTWLDNMTPEDRRSVTSRYLESYYLSFVMMVGENIGPANDVERLYVSVVLLVGACFYASVVGNMALLVSNLNATNARHKHKQELVTDVVRYLGLPQDITDRVQEYFDYLASFAHPGPDGMNFLSDLPNSLFEDISMYLHGERVRAVPLFANVEDAFITSLVTRLRHAVFMPSEIVFRAGDVGHEMYMIYKGRVAVINSHGETVAILREGGFFGELALLATARRTANCTTLSHCDMAVLRAGDLALTMKDFPDSASRVREAALGRLQEIQNTGNIEDEAFEGRQAPAIQKKLEKIAGVAAGPASPVRRSGFSKRESTRMEKAGRASIAGRASLPSQAHGSAVTGAPPAPVGAGEALFRDEPKAQASPGGEAGAGQVDKLCALVARLEGKVSEMLATQGEMKSQLRALSTTQDGGILDSFGSALLGAAPGPSRPGAAITMGRGGRPDRRESEKVPAQPPRRATANVQFGADVKRDTGDDGVEVDRSRGSITQAVRSGRGGASVGRPKSLAE